MENTIAEDRLTMASRPLLRWLHLLVGIAGLAAFLLTGQFMDRSLDHLAGMPDALRGLYRSGHIYILFAALLNLLLGVYLVRSAARVPRTVQAIGSAFVLAAPALFVYGFAVETPLGLIERPVTRTGIVWSLLGVLLHGAAQVRPNFDRFWRNA